MFEEEFDGGLMTGWGVAALSMSAGNDGPAILTASIGGTTGWQSESISADEKPLKQ